MGAVDMKLACYGIKFSRGLFRSIKATYFRIALEQVKQYEADAVIMAGRPQTLSVQSAAC